MDLRSPPDTCLSDLGNKKTSLKSEIINILLNQFSFREKESIVIASVSEDSKTNNIKVGFSYVASVTTDTDHITNDQLHNSLTWMKHSVFEKVPHASKFPSYILIYD